MDQVHIYIMHSAHDQLLAQQLEDHLYRHISVNKLITRDDKLSDGTISQTKVLQQAINAHLILPIISEPFLKSDYNFEIAETVLRLHKAKKAVVIPIKGQAVQWDSSPYHACQALPNDTIFGSLSGGNTIGAFLNVSSGIQNVIERLDLSPQPQVELPNTPGVTTREELVNLIAKDDAETVLDTLQSILTSGASSGNLRNQVLLLQARYNRALRDARSGLVSLENESVERTDILASLLKLIDKVPEEILKQDVVNIESYLDSKNAVISYDIGNTRYDELESEIKTRSIFETDYLNEVKLVLVGNGGVGKTTLRKNIVNPEYGITQHESTIGLEVVTVMAKGAKYGDVQLNIWDFGGQGKYRSIQQFFCTPNTMYLYVTQPNDQGIQEEEDEYVGFEYWISFINSFGYNPKTDQDSPIIYIMNKSDLASGKDLPVKKASAFDNILAYVSVSCKTGEGLRDLVRGIRTFLDHTQMVGREFSTRWLEVKEEIRKIDKKYIPLQEFGDICKKKGLKQEDQETLLQYLVSVGVVLYFPETLTLINYIILDPNWVRALAYNAIDSQHIQRGFLSNHDALKVWQDFQSDVQVAIDLLENFDLCFRANKEGENGYIFPRLLPKIRTREERKIGQYEDFAFVYECQFEPFIHASIFERLVVKLSDRLDDLSTCWRGLIAFHNNSCKVVIKEMWQEKKIMVYVDGPKALAMPFLIILRDKINTICEQINRQRHLYLFSSKGKITHKQKEITLDQIFDTEGRIVIKHLEVKDGGVVQVADDIHNKELNASTLEQHLISE